MFCCSVRPANSNSPLANQVPFPSDLTLLFGLFYSDNSNSDQSNSPLTRTKFRFSWSKFQWNLPRSLEFCFLQLTKTAIPTALLVVQSVKHLKLTLHKLFWINATNRSRIIYPRIIIKTPKRITISDVISSICTLHTFPVRIESIWYHFQELFSSGNSSLAFSQCSLSLSGNSKVAFWLIWVNLLFARTLIIRSQVLIYLLNHVLRNPDADISM